MSFGVDYAGTASAAAVHAMKAAGVEFVCRYFSHSGWKNLTPAEARALTAAELWIAVVWETAADRARDGRAAGVQDARDALAQAQACGMPDGRPIYFAADWDVQAGETATVNAYLDGAASVLGKSRVGLYGGHRAVKAALDGGHCAWAWSTYAWSGGLLDSRTHIYQYSNDHTIGGVGLDYDKSLKSDFGQWKVGVSPDTPTPPTPKEEDDMPTGLLTDGPDAITPIALPKGRYKTIGFIADNGLQGLAAAQLRVAVHQGVGNWHIEHVTVDSAKGQAVVVFPDQANTDGISVQRSDGGTVHVAYEVS